MSNIKPLSIRNHLFLCVLVLVLAACNSRNSGDVSEAHKNFVQSVSSAVLSAHPIGSKEELQSRLKLPADRLASFDLNHPISQNVSAMMGSGFWCGPNGCICIGDLDCNDMFSTVCRSPSTGGQCVVNGRVVFCTCTPTRI